MDMLGYKKEKNVGADQFQLSLLMEHQLKLGRIYL